MNQRANVQRALEQFMRTYGMWLILGLMALEWMLAWWRQQDQSSGQSSSSRLPHGSLA
jgi:hypothetical protein